MSDDFRSKRKSTILIIANNHSAQIQIKGLLKRMLAHPRPYIFIITLFLQISSNL